MRGTVLSLRPAERSYGRYRRHGSGFTGVSECVTGATRWSLGLRSRHEPPPPGVRPGGVRGFVEATGLPVSTTQKKILVLLLLG